MTTYGLNLPDKCVEPHREKWVLQHRQPLLSAFAKPPTPAVGPPFTSLENKDSFDFEKGALL